jgi:hypothetical protein
MRDLKPLPVEPDLLPQSAGNKWKEYERKALEIRRFAGADLRERLNPMKLAELLNLRVVALADLRHLSDKARNHLAASDNWSGGVTQPLPDGSRIVVINDRQSPERQGATLMEEICHSLLGHEPSVISATGEGGDGGGGGRSYDRAIEEEAYAVGAAALLPYRALSELLSRGDSVSKIARHFGVTKSLVEYRIRVLGLW